MTPLTSCSQLIEGWKRIGCLFCPMAPHEEKRRWQRRYPGYDRAFRRAFNRLYANRKAAGNPSVDRWADGDEMYEWWLYGDDDPPDVGMGNLFD